MAELQSLVPASLAPGTRIKTDTVNGEEIEYVKIDLGGTGVSVPMTSQNFGSWLSVANRSLVITYTDSTKATIDHVDFKESGTTIYTLTLVGASTTDTWTRT